MAKKKASNDDDGNDRNTLPLLRWLNGEVGSGRLDEGRMSKASRARVLALLRDIIEAKFLLAVFDREHPNYDYFDFPFDPQLKSINAKLRQIQRVLSDYTLVPVIEIAYSNEDVILDVNNALGARRPLGEQSAVWDIVNLSKSRKLDMVRQCACEKWFLASRRDQKACSPICRHKAYEQTDAFKASRRAYMRDYYKLKQSGKVK